MSWASVADALGGGALLVGALLCLTSAVGLLRLPDVYSRMHAASKPQALGILLVLVGLGLRLRTPGEIGVLVLVALFQLATIPVSAHLLARAQYRQVEVHGATPRPDDVADGPVDGDGA